MTQYKSNDTNYLNLKDFEKDEIFIIPVESLLLHPGHSDDAEDITELIENIKKNGVLKNLIVVPCAGYHYGKYTVISSYRIFAAAKAAEVKELPCRVAHMNEEEQLEIIKLYR